MSSVSSTTCTEPCHRYCCAEALHHPMLVPHFALMDKGRGVPIHCAQDKIHLQTYKVAG